MRKIGSTLFLIFSLTYILFAGKTEQTYYFQPPNIQITDGEAHLTMPECWTTGLPGEPQLPIKGCSVLLPPGSEAVSLNLEYPQPISLGSGYHVPPTEEQYPLSQIGPFPPTPENQDIYTADNYYPSELVSDLLNQYKRGYSISHFQIHPVIYNPVTGEIAYYPWIKVTVSTQNSAAAEQAYSKFYRGLTKDQIIIQGQVDNPQAVSLYNALPDDPETDDAELLIITCESLEPSFHILADYKNARGTSAKIVLYEWILTNYGGIDPPDQIRNCIIDYYFNHGTDYVLLAGDNEIIPKRSLYAQAWSEVDPDIAADLYYGCLDGNYDGNGNGVFGEISDSPDLMGEVYTGRASVDSPTEAENFIQKQIAYQHTPVADELAQGLMLGEDLEWAAWGSEYKEEIRLGSSSWGYTTVGFPGWFDVGTLYDTPAYHWSAMSDLLPLLNEGPQLVNHLGHANNTYALKFGANSVNDNNMTNDGVNHNYYIIYSQGCYCNSWDNRMPNFGITGSDAISEKWTTIANGAVCFIGNTRYGWGSYNNTNGASQYSDRQFFDAIFGENIYQIGRAHQDSKEDVIPFLNNVTYYVYYECCLLGDPSLEIWTDVPQPITVNCDTVISVGDTSFTIEVVGLTGALCTISQNGEILGSTSNGSFSSVTIELSEPISSTDPVRLMVTKHDYLPYDLYLVVYVPNAPNMIFNCVEVDDSQGDADGILDLGEQSDLDITVTNFGGVDANAVSSLLSSNDLYVTILDSFEVIENVPHDSTVTLQDAFQLQIADDVPDHHIAEFTFNMMDFYGNTWEDQFTLEISAPVVIMTDVIIDDGNDLRLEPGESAQIFITLNNTGSGEARILQGDIFTDNPYLNINTANAEIILLESGAAAQLEPPFQVSAAVNCPLSANIPVYLTMSDDMGYYSSAMFEIIMGGILENFESGSPGWTHSTVTTGFNDQWTLTDYRNYTPNGTTSWHCGPPDGSNYGNHLDAALYSPEYDILPGATLTFRHWMDAETSPSNIGLCYDGGIVQMSLDGSAWMQLFPVGGYNSCILDNPDMGPFAPLIYVYSGEILWEEAIFDLDVFPDGIGIIRFRFGSNGSDTREGWYIDDVEMTYMASIQAPTNFQGEWEDSVTVHLSWNSPGFTPNPSPGGKSGERYSEDLSGYRVYRNDEMIADDIQALEYFDDMRPLNSGTYTYEVTALFSKGESYPTQPISFDYISLSASNQDNLIPEEYSVKPNYPNPFNSGTIIRYDLPEAAEVRLVVYDILGREVQTLVNTWQNAGFYLSVWQADFVPSGIYFYTLQAGSFKTTGKMLLLK